jgi:hypothetical protein
LHANYSSFNANNLIRCALENTSFMRGQVFFAVSCAFATHLVSTPSDTHALMAPAIDDLAAAAAALVDARVREWSRPSAAAPPHTVSTAAVTLPLHAVSAAALANATWLDHYAPGAFLEGNNTLPAAVCATEPNPAPLDFKAFCSSGPNSTGCWPANFLLGAQKAATTSVTQLLMECDVATFAWSAAPAYACSGGALCKETHAFQGHDAEETVARDPASYTRLFATELCDEAGGDAREYSFGWRYVAADTARGPQAACAAARFVEATPVFGDGQTFALLADLMGARLLGRARFAMILREPLARQLSWYNHQRHAGRFGAETNADGRPCLA